jgi:hypothetical protein
LIAGGKVWAATAVGNTDAANMGISIITSLWDIPYLRCLL